MRREEYFAEQFKASRHMILVTPTNRKADKKTVGNRIKKIELKCESINEIVACLMLQSIDGNGYRI